MTLSPEDKELLWSRGRLSWKLDSSQKKAYDQFRAWEKFTYEARLRGEALPGIHPRVFVFDEARRTGKDYKTLLIMIENALRRPGAIFSYGTAYQKDVSEILVGLFERICEDCPLHMKAVYRDAWRGQAAGLFFPNKSIIRMIGCDRGADNLRGRFSNGVALSECGFMDSLKEVIVSILMPQLQGDQRATILLNSTPPLVPGHPYDDLFVPDAHERGAIVERTIEDNPRLSRAEKDEFIRAAGGLESENCQREYFCKRIRSATRVVLPEFDRARHVKASPVPKYARAYTVMDPGMRDLCGVLWAYHDFERDKIVIRKSWAQRNTNTDTLVKVLKGTEEELWGGLQPLQFWETDKFKSNPSLRVTDVEVRLVTDLQQLHGLKVVQARKDDKTSALHALRNAFLQDRIEVHPDAKEAIAHFENAVWNKARTDFDRSDMYGHYDLLAAAVYLERHVNRGANPNPPHGITVLNSSDRDRVWILPHHKITKNGLLGTLNTFLPSRWSRK